MCLAQVRSARKTFHSHGGGLGFILSVFCFVGARTVRCTDAAAGAAYYNCPTARPDAACLAGSRRHRSSVISGAGGIAQCEDLRFEAHRGNMTIGLSASSGPFVRQIVTELFDLLCQACTEHALSCTRAVDDMHGLTAWQPFYKKYNPRTMARAIRVVASVKHVDPVPSFSDAPTYRVESVWDNGIVDVDGGGRRKSPKEVSPAWCPPAMTRTAFRSRTGQANRVAAPRAPMNGCRFQALQEEEELPEGEDRTCMVCGVDDEKLTREAQLEFCEVGVRKPLASAVRVAKTGNGIWLEAHGSYIEHLATKERMEVREETVST